MEFMSQSITCDCKDPWVAKDGFIRTCGCRITLISGLHISGKHPPHLRKTAKKGCSYFLGTFFTFFCAIPILIANEAQTPLNLFLQDPLDPIESRSHIEMNVVGVYI